MKMENLIFLDIEASGLGADSFPIEIGWAYLNGQSDGFLIRPASAWSHWDTYAEDLHGLSREQLHRDGIDIWAAATRLNAEFAGKHRHAVISDAIENDLYWLDRLFGETPYSREFDVIDILYAARTASLDFVLFDNRETPASVHRAKPDALALREAWLTSMRSA